MSSYIFSTYFFPRITFNGCPNDLTYSMVEFFNENHHQASQVVGTPVENYMGKNMSKNIYEDIFFAYGFWL